MIVYMSYTFFHFDSINKYHCTKGRCGHALYTINFSHFCLCYSRTGSAAIHAFSNVDEEDESGTLVFKEN